MMQLVQRIRLSLGTAIHLNLVDGTPIPHFTTAFLMTHKQGKCNANCAFCPQARESSSSADRLSRISWPDVSYEQFREKLPLLSTFSRVCIQSLNYPKVVEDVLFLVQEIRSTTDTPISVSIHPLQPDELVKLRNAGVSNVGVAFDACTQVLFDKVKGSQRGSSYRWDLHDEALLDALEVFGKGHVTTHLMIGLGETEEEAVDFLFRMKDLGISIGLFAFTNIRGTALENQSPPDLAAYRRIQVIRFLMVENVIQRKDVSYSEHGAIRLGFSESDLREHLSSGKAFEVSGCVGCNRPFYNERPSGTMYNYPCPLTKDEVLSSLEETGLWF